MQPSFIKKNTVIITTFLIANIVFLVFQQKLLSLKINTTVVLAANTLLFVLSLIGVALQTKAINRKNANAAIRGVMGAAIVKLLVLAIAAILYIFIEKANSNIGAIAISLALYIVYAVIETRTALKFNRQQSAGDRTPTS
jgi:hypothetical protein